MEGTAHPCTSVNSEEEGGMSQKSEAPIRAMNSGNAEGAKGCRFEITGEGTMTQHRVDYVHDTKIDSFHTEGACRTRDTVHGPDGIAL